MPEPVTEADRGALPPTVEVGFCGKLPCRGDFVAAGLPRRFIEPWHDWMQRMLASSRDALGEEWLPAWLEAPIWRFWLARGICGPDAVLGAWMPSVDRIGRHFPLTLAATAPEGEPRDLLCGSDGFLAAIEAAGLDSLAFDLAPEALAARLAVVSAPEGPGAADLTTYPEHGARWWTDGAPRVPATAFVTVSLPEPARFVTMLDARISVAER